MERVKAIFKEAWPYKEGRRMDLPVLDLPAAVSFYETVMGFRVESWSETPHKSVVLGRDGIRIGLAENGGDPTQEGCFFEVDNVEAAFAELQSNGLSKERVIDEQRHGDTWWKVFFVVAPDGLCYCLGEKLP